MLGIALVATLFAEGTALQILPFSIFALLGYMQLYAKKDVRLWIVLLSALMILINLSIVSWVDVAAWIFTIIVFII